MPWPFPEERVRAVVAEAGGNVTLAAEIIGMPRSTLCAMAIRWKIPRRSLVLDRRFSKAELKAALKKSDGSARLAAKRLGCSRHSVRVWADRWGFKRLTKRVAADG
jgi:transcriptional regulator with GAF, ATPase, and Fis domain